MRTLDASFLRHLKKNKEYAVGNHTKVFDLFSGKPAQRRLRNLFARFRATYNNLAVVKRGRLSFLLYAPGGRLDEALLRSLTVRVTVTATGATHEARINRVQRYDPARSVSWLRTAVLTPPLRDIAECPHALEIEIVSSCGKHGFVDPTTSLERQHRS